MNVRRLLSAFVLVFVAVACGGSTTPQAGSSTPPASSSGSPSPSPSTSSNSLTGTWTGTYQSTTTTSAYGTFTIVFTQAGSQLNGTIDIKNSGCISTGTITGTVSGGTITFGAVKGAQTIDYTGTVSGTTMSGTYSAPQCAHGKGTWTATRSG
jgi:hypothetical protein